MRLARNRIGRDQIDQVMSRLAEILKDMDPETITDFEVNCFPWRDGKRLQAVSGHRIVSVAITLAAEGSNQISQDQAWTIRESSYERRPRGLEALLGGDVE